LIVQQAPQKKVELDDDDDDESYQYLSEEEDSLSFECLSKDEIEEVVQNQNIEMPKFSTKNRKSENDEIELANCLTRMEVKDLVIEHPTALTTFDSKDGHEIIAVDIAVISGSVSTQYVPRVSEDGRSLIITYSLDDFFMDPDWIVLSQQGTEDSPRYLAYLRFMLNLKKKRGSSPTAVQIIKLPFEVERKVYYHELFSFPAPNEESHVVQIYSVQLKSLFSLLEPVKKSMKVFSRSPGKPDKVSSSMMED
jgi:hypothetical protein